MCGVVGGVVGWGVWVGRLFGRVCVRGGVGAWGGVGSLERESIAHSALLSGYLGKSGHLPRYRVVVISGTIFSKMNRIMFEFM